MDRPIAENLGKLGSQLPTYFDGYLASVDPFTILTQGDPLVIPADSEFIHFLIDSGLSLTETE